MDSVTVIALHSDHISDQKISLRGSLTSEVSPDAPTSLGFIPGVYVRSASIGGVNTLRYKGLSASQIDTRWEGFRINNVQLGNDDLLSLQQGLFNTISLANQPSRSSDFGLFLEQKPVKDRQLSAQLNNGDGYRLMGVSRDFKLDFKYDKFQFNHAFPALGSSPADSHRKPQNSKLIQLGSSWNPSWNSKLLSLPGYVSFTKRSFPISVFSTNQLSRLSTLTFKQLISYSPVKNVNFKVGYFFDGLSYQLNENSSIDTGITHQLVSSGSIDLPKQLKAFIDFRFVNSDHSQYSTSGSFVTTESYIRHQLQTKAGKFTSSIGMIGQSISGFKPYGSVSYYPKTSQTQSLQISFGRRVRFPNLDDRLWSEGGSTSIQPEQSWSAIGNFKKLLPKQLTITSSAYYRQTDDYIIWLPDLPFWRPQNLLQVVAYGFSASIAKPWKIKATTVETTLGYDYNRLYISKTSDGSFAERLNNTQLPFAPEHQTSLSINANGKRFRYGAQMRLNSRVFTGFGETNPADKNLLARIYAGFKINQNNLLTAAIENLFNQVTPVAFANGAPLRRFHINFSTSINKNEKTTTP